MALFKPRQTSLIILLLLLSACGQQGPLVPAEPEGNPTVTPTSSPNGTDSEPTP